MKKSLSRFVGIGIGLFGAISRDDLIFVISVLITILNLYLEYLERKRATKSDVKPEKELE